MAKHEVTKKEKSDLTVPEYLKEFQGEGLQDIDQNELQLPFVKIVQKLSQEIEDGAAKYGDIINSVTKDALKNADGTISFVIVKTFVDYKHFEEGKLKNHSKDGINWTNAVEGIDYASELWRYKSFNFACLLLQDGIPLDGIPYCLSLGRTSAKTGRALLNLVAQKCNMQQLPIFGRVFNLKIDEEQNDAKQKYMVWKLLPESSFTPQDICIKAQQARKFLGKLEINTKNIPDEDLMTEPTEL